jgi:uncharacterized protein YjbI with pentapeptide repeats
MMIARKPKRTHAIAGMRIMMKQLFGLIALFLAGTASATAQNPAQIARAQSGAGCPGCNLFQADLAYRNLERADFSRARLRQADLSLSTFNHARFDGADLVTANLFAARFTGATFTNADLSRATLVGAHFGGADLTGARLEGANLSGAELADARGLTLSQLAAACGDASTTLPPGLRAPACRTAGLTAN